MLCACLTSASACVIGGTSDASTDTNSTANTESVESTESADNTDSSEETEATLFQSIAVSNQKTEFAYGEDFTCDALVVQGESETGDWTAITEYEVDSSAYDAYTVGEYTITVTYGDLDAEYTVTVLPSTIVASLSVTSQTTTFSVGDEFIFDGVVTATYEDGRTETVQDYVVDASKYNAFKAGTQRVKVTAFDVSATYNVTVEKVNKLRILMIGNSYSDDTSRWLYSLAASLGFQQEDIIVGNLVKGGCQLDWHYEYSQNNSHQYYFRMDENGQYTHEKPSSTGETLNTMEEGIQYYPWDYITLQQASQLSGKAETYNEQLDGLVEYVKSKATNPNVKLVWNMTWAYEQAYTNINFANYNYSQGSMYEAITKTVQNQIETRDAFCTVSPAGTAIQNARTSVMGDTLNMDGTHLSRGCGRFIAALTMFCTLTGYTPADIDYQTIRGYMTSHKAERGDMTEKEFEVACESVTNALAAKYTVTQSKIV